jgi:hypothetical protein
MLVHQGGQPRKALHNGSRLTMQPAASAPGARPPAEQRRWRAARSGGCCAMDPPRDGPGCTGIGLRAASMATSILGQTSAVVTGTGSHDLMHTWRYGQRLHLELFRHVHTYEIAGLSSTRQAAVSRRSFRESFTATAGWGSFVAAGNSALSRATVARGPALSRAAGSGGVATNNWRRTALCREIPVRAASSRSRQKCGQRVSHLTM